MALELEIRSNELGEILKVVDEGVHLLNHFDMDQEMNLVKSVREKVDWTMEKMVNQNQLELYSQLSDLIYYMDLACFSLLCLNGDSFQIYLQEVNQRYRKILSHLSCSSFIGFQ